MTTIPTIAVLLTCYNRKDKTLECLQALYMQEGLGSNYEIDIFLVDDGSTDRTSIEVKLKYPLVNVIEGTGHLFWNQGMRLAWQNARIKDYDFYLWLNDDTLLDKDALIKIIEVYIEAKDFEQKEVIITGACRKELNDNSFSYGGSTNFGPVHPNGKIQKCEFINGNAVLVSKGIYQKIGILSNDYTHGMGDFDYGLRALKKGFYCYTTKGFVATCAPNEGIPGWCNPDVPFTKRWKLFHSPRGLNIKEYIRFRKKFWGIKWINFTVKAYLKMISPKLYKKIAELI